MYVEYEDISLDILRYPKDILDRTRDIVTPTEYQDIPHDMLDLGHCEYEDISGYPWISRDILRICCTWALGPGYCNKY